MRANIVKTRRRMGRCSILLVLTRELTMSEHLINELEMRQKSH
jgi:hypothetical protein